MHRIGGEEKNARRYSITSCEEDDDSAPQSHLLNPRQTHKLSRCRLGRSRLVGLVVVLSMYSFATTALLLANYYCSTADGEFYSPAQTAIQYERSYRHITDEGYSSPYSGTPSSEQLEAWEDLGRPQIVQLTEDEMVRSGVDIDSSVRVLHQPLYPASLGVYHELHCLKAIRKWYLMSNLTDIEIGDRDKDPEYRSRHLDHCLETLRLSITCNANLELYTWSYPSDPENTHLDMHSVSSRKCINWDHLDRWARSRSEGSPFLLEPRPDDPEEGNHTLPQSRVAETRHLAHSLLELGGFWKDD